MQESKLSAHAGQRRAGTKAPNVVKYVALALCAGLMLIGTGCEKLKSRDEMNKGVQAYRANHYAEAVDHFKKAVEYDPTNENARLYLATSYMIQWVPGAESPDNKKN